MKYCREVYEKALQSLAELRATLSESERATLDFVAEAIAEKGDREYGQAHNLGEPLTLEQLREMDGQPVWVRISENWRESGIYEGWMLIRFHGKDDRIRAYTYDTHFGATFHAQQDYGISWWAYAYPPAHIDLSEWIPFETIGGTKGVACKKCGYREYHHIKYSQFSFCPNCGRPTTENARAMLEKRLRGCAEC